MSITSRVDGDSLQDRIAAKLATMSRAERKVAEYLRNHSQEVVFATAEDIGTASGTSDATVVRTAKTLGYSGLAELKYSIGQQVINGTKPTERLRHRIEQVGPHPRSLLQHVFAEATERIAETLRQTSENDLTRAADLIAGADEVLCYGVGPSESVARYLALRLCRLGRRARSSGATGFRLADDLVPVDDKHAIVLYLPSRMLHDTEVILSHARRVGAAAILFSDSLGPLLGDRVDVALPAVHSPSGFTGETLSSQVMTDALALAVAARSEFAATEASDLLTELRSELIGADSRNYVTRNDRRGH